MFNPNNFFHTLFLIPILNILIGFYKLFFLLRVPGALGVAIIFLTVLIRLILYPLTAAQIKSAQKMNKLKPDLDKLNIKHKGDKQRLYQEQMRLYKESGINPTAGCLPLLLQMPLLIGLYNLFFQILTHKNPVLLVGEINKVLYFAFLRISSLDLSFFGLNLVQKPSDWAKSGWGLLLIPVITALLQYVQTKMMTPVASLQKEKPEKEDKKKEEDMSVMMQKQMSFLMPAMIGFFAYSFPLGLSLYWNTFTIFGIIQQYQLNKSFQGKK